MSDCADISKIKNSSLSTDVTWLLKMGVSENIALLGFGKSVWPEMHQNVFWVAIRRFEPIFVPYAFTWVILEEFLSRVIFYAQPCRSVKTWDLIKEKKFLSFDAIDFGNNVYGQAID